MQTQSIRSQTRSGIITSPVRFLWSKKFKIYGVYTEDFLGFPSKRFNNHKLYHFLDLANVQDLEIGRLDIPGFRQNVHPYLITSFQHSDLSP